MTTFNVPEMSCGHCKAAIEKSVAAADPASDVAIDIDGRTVQVQSGLDDAALLAAIKDAGYEATVVG